LTLGSCAGWSTVLEVRTLELAAGPAQGIVVQTANGRVAIDADPTFPAPDTVHVVAHLRARNESRLAAARIDHEFDDRGQLVLTVRWPEGRRLGNEGCAFEVTTARVDGVLVRTSNGSVTVRGAAGLARIESSNGNLVLENHQGGVVGKTSNGNLVFRDVLGSIHATSSNGNVEAQRVGGKLTLDTSNGNVRVALHPDNTGPVQVESSNGSLSLAVGEAFYGRLDMRTSNGRVRVEADRARALSASRSHATMVFGEDGPSSKLRTSNGNITVNQTGG
jgi:hypothetical protein